MKGQIKKEEQEKISQNPFYKIMKRRKPNVTRTRTELSEKLEEEGPCIKPDIITMAKGIANGMPLSAVATTQEIAESAVGQGLTLSTFGGNPVACAAGIGTLESMMEDYTPARSALIGAELEQGLKALQTKYPIIGEVRGRGLMQGVEVELPQAPSAPIDKADDEPLIVSIKADGSLYINLGGDPEKAVTIESIKERVSKVIKQKPGTPVLVWGDKKIPYGEVVSLMTVLQAAGAPSVGLVTDTPPPKKS